METVFSTVSLTDVGSKKEHSFTNYVSNNDATCTADGTKTAKCDNCTATDTVTDEGTAKGHDFTGNAEYCRNGCGTKNPNYTAPVMPPYTPVRPTPTPVPTPVEPEQPENPFTDVSKDDYFFDAVIWAVENGITSGTSETTFDPHKVCTRAEMVTFLWRAAGKPEPISKDNPFTDVTENCIYYNHQMTTNERETIAEYLGDTSSDVLAYKVVLIGAGSLYKANMDGGDGEEVSSNQSIVHSLFNYPDGLYCKAILLADTLERVEFN